MFKKFFSFAFSLAVLAAILFVLFDFRTILDYTAFRTASPGSVAEKYSAELDLTEKARLIFYGTYPKIDSKIEFNADCNPGKNILEFGCYYNGVNKIYLLDIKEPNLKTMINVGAGHELMHAVYSRFSNTEKARIDSSVEADYARLKNKDLDDRLASYAKTEPGNRANELHSILATEELNINPELEAHYRKYFNNRAKIVAWHTANKDYLKGKETELNTERASIETDNKALETFNANMESLKSSGKILDYNRLVPQQNKMVTDLKAKVDTYNKNVVTYNDILASINSHTLSSFDAALIK